MVHRSLCRFYQPRRAGPGLLWTDRHEQDEADQLEELRRVLRVRQLIELERRKHFQTHHVVFAPGSQVCVKEKGIGAQHLRQTIKELGK